MKSTKNAGLRGPRSVDGERDNFLAFRHSAGAVVVEPVAHEDLGAGSDLATLRREDRAHRNRAHALRICDDRGIVDRGGENVVGARRDVSGHLRRIFHVPVQVDGADEVRSDERIEVARADVSGVDGPSEGPVFEAPLGRVHVLAVRDDVEDIRGGSTSRPPFQFCNRAGKAKQRSILDGVGRLRHRDGLILEGRDAVPRRQIVVRDGVDGFDSVEFPRLVHEITQELGIPRVAHDRKQVVEGDGVEALVPQLRKHHVLFCFVEEEDIVFLIPSIVCREGDPADAGG